MNSSAQVLHEQAMEYADQATVAIAKKHPLDYRYLYEQAYLLEKEAALLAPPEGNRPLPRSILIRSAAALAYKAGNYPEAEKMIALGRSENPPDFVAQELDEIEDLVRKARAGTEQDDRLHIKGELIKADADTNEIEIRDAESRQVHAFKVPSQQFKRIVKSYWQEVVAAVGKTGPKGNVTLEKISLAGR